MKKLYRNLLLICTLVVLAACQTSSKDNGLTAGEKVAAYYPENIIVSVSEEYTKGLFNLEPEKTALLNNGLRTQLKSDLGNDLLAVMKGQKPGTVKVLLTHVALASGAGRLLFSADSTITGTITILDDNDQLLVTREITARDEGSKARASINGNPLIGLAINLAANAAKSSEAKRVGHISQNFRV